MAPEPPCQVSQNRVPVLELYRKRRAGVDLTNGPKDFQWGFFGRFGSTLGLSGTGTGVTAASYGRPAFVKFIGPVYTQPGGGGRPYGLPNTALPEVLMATQTLQERTGVITFKGNPMTLVGPELKAGDPAPDFHLTASDLSVKTLEDVVDHGNRAAMLIVVPSLDTSVCSIESHKFNTRMGELPTGVKTYVVSMDLPFAQARWCGNEGDVKFETLSDYRDHTFGRNYGLLIKELGLLARAIVVIGAGKQIKYVQIVPEVASEPDYDAALQAAAAAAK